MCLDGLSLYDCICAPHTFSLFYFAFPLCFFGCFVLFWFVCVLFARLCSKEKKEAWLALEGEEVGRIWEEIRDGKP